MLISLHLPKTAGSSFVASLEQYYGDRILRDYTDLPINTPVLRRNRRALVNSVLTCFRDYDNIDCIHGHFLPLKYFLYGILNKDVQFVTWVRDPVERLASHYYFWVRSYHPDKAPLLHKRVVEEKWSFERFCLSEELRNFYCQFLWGFPLARFSFIGLWRHSWSCREAVYLGDA